MACLQGKGKGSRKSGMQFRHGVLVGNRCRAFDDRECRMLRIRDRGETAERAPRGLCQPSPSEPFCTYDCVFCLLDFEIRRPARLDVPSRNLLLADRPVAASCTPDRGVAPGIAFVAPTEQLAEERLRPLDIACRELTPAKRTHDIDDRRADALARLPQRQIPAGWISDRGHTTGI